MVEAALAARDRRVVERGDAGQDGERNIVTRGFVDNLDFRTTLLNGMLSFLLFAGAFQINLRDMRDGRWAILILSSVGTLISTIITGFGLKLLLTFSGPDVPLISLPPT